MFLLAVGIFGLDLASEPHFVDESAYVSQSYFFDIYLNRDFDNPSWLEYPGYDLPPLPKYLIGLALKAEGFRRPGPSAMRAWYADTSQRFLSIEGLVTARRPSVVLGAIGCVAIFALGSMGFDRRVGYVSALLLMANPLYRMHARRAMSDVPAEALILVTAAIGLWGWRWILSSRPDGISLRKLAGAAGTFLLSGIFCGLATLSKLNGALGGFILAAWAGMSIPLRLFTWQARSLVVLAIASAMLPAVATFWWFNPFLTAHPTVPLSPGLLAISRMSLGERMKMVAEHRSTVSISAKSMFPKDALISPRDKIEVVAVQGFGRFGPFGPWGQTDSTIRFDRRQDWGAWLWLPWVTIGFALALARGRNQYRLGQPPTAWAIATQAVVALVTVTAFIPLAWDRYFLSIQPASTILGAATAVSLFDLGRRILDRSPSS